MHPALKKISLTLKGRKTAISLEPGFQAALLDIAAERNISMPKLVGEIAADPAGSNLSSSCRVYVLRHYMAAARHEVRR